MKCPACAHEAPDTADSCFNCGLAFHTLVALKRGSLVAGRYEVLAPLGQGGMGAVYKARDHKLEETVALKVLRADVRHDRDMQTRFMREIRLARRVRHRNVCAIHEYGEEGGLRYISMEHIEGVDLRKVLTERGALPPDQAFEACIRVAEGLQAIHEAGIIHRDLKPANLMIDAHGVVRLMDFGIAKQMESEAAVGATATGLIVGTPEYMSPEQARGDKLDPRSDVYALGIVAFELFTGKVPFRGQTPMATIFKHLQDAPPFDGPAAAALPKEAVPVVRRALAKSAEDRQASAIEFAHAMVEAREAAGIPPPAAGPLTPRPGTTVLGSAATPRPLTFGQGPPTIGQGPTPTRLEAPRHSDALPDVLPTVAVTTTAGRAAAGRAGAGQRPGRGPSRGVLAGGAALVVALLVGGVWMATRGPREAAAPIPPDAPAAAPTTLAAAAPAGAPATALSASGTLVIDALPWGQVAEVVDASGTRRNLGSGAETPLALDLPPGEYTVRVRHPSFTDVRSVSAVVKAGAVERRLVEFRRVDAADYFRKTGS
jgi:tRNA A-37 threonylcarbamoyl transferase component Bud32